MKRILGLSLALIGLQLAGVTPAAEPLFAMAEIRDADTLAFEVLQDWHVVAGSVPTRQKFGTIRVGTLWPGQDYRVPIRFIVPVEGKAAGFHLTGGHHLAELKTDAVLKGVDTDLIRGGVGLVRIVVQAFDRWGQDALAEALRERFLETLDPHFSIQYWAWPASLMRAVTAALAESDHFAPGKVALSGVSKNGASPSLAILHDERMTAVYAARSPIWESPLRLCDPEAWRDLKALNGRDGQTRPHAFMGGTLGPVYLPAAMEAGHAWETVQAQAKELASQLFISQNLEALAGRGVEFLFEPGTHDFVIFDVPWGGRHYPQIPLYLRANAGHANKKGTTRPPGRSTTARPFSCDISFRRQWNHSSTRPRSARACRETPSK